MRTQSDLFHDRNIRSSRPTSERAEMLVRSLNQMLSSIPSDNYSDLESREKLTVLRQVIDVYDFIWNEAMIQLRELNSDYASVFGRLKIFFNSLFEKYPKLLSDFDHEVTHLHAVIQQKDQNFCALQGQIRASEGQLLSSGDLITGLKRKLARVRERKTYFKNAWNTQVQKCEELTAKITEIRCEMSQLSGEVNRGHSPRQEPPVAAVQSVEEEARAPPPRVVRDVGVDTADLPRPPDATRRTRERPPPPARAPSPDLAIPVSPSRESELEEAPPPDRLAQSPSRALDSPLRQAVYDLMQAQAPLPAARLGSDHPGELKKFFWVYPKVLSIFVNGLEIEDQIRPFPDFETVVIASMTRLYQTRFLTTQMTQNLIQSAQVLDAMDPLIALFNAFLRNEYDILQYRFFTILLDHSLGCTIPPIADLIHVENLTATDTNLTLPLDVAHEIYQDIFPFDDQPDFGDSDPLGFCDLLLLSLNKFDACRHHLWNVVKCGFLLSDCPDLSHITRPHFLAFMALTLPDAKIPEAKQLWNDLRVRNRAEGNDRPWLAFEDITHLVTHRDAFFFAVMRVKLCPTFSALFFDFNASMLNAVAFIVNRVVYSVPALEAHAMSGAAKIAALASTLRACLFRCDISGAFLQYRAMLHVVDADLVADGRTVIVSNRSSANEVHALLGHFLDRERAVGLSQAAKEPRESAP
jgi:hypothetical protein